MGPAQQALLCCILLLLLLPLLGLSGYASTVVSVRFAILRERTVWETRSLHLGACPGSI